MYKIVKCGAMYHVTDTANKIIFQSLDIYKCSEFVLTNNDNYAQYIRRQFGIVSQYGMENCTIRVRDALGNTTGHIKVNQKQLDAIQQILLGV